MVEEQLTHWPLRAKVTVALLAIILLCVVALATANGVKEEELRAMPSPAPSGLSASAPSSAPLGSTTTAASVDTSTSTFPPAVPTTAAHSPPPPLPPEGRADAHRLLAELRVVDQPMTAPGYSRDLFPTWLDLDGNGCDAREDTLIAESLAPPEVGSGCEVISGRWFSLYDGLEITAPAELDVDHLVPLAEAWRSGASGWDTVRRAAFANELTFPDHLIAVTAAMNRSKSDSPPDEWRPPRRESWCPYASAWVSVKQTWALTITTSEREALGRMLETC